MVSFQDFFSLCQEFFKLSFLWERDAVDSLKTVAFGVGEPVARRVLHQLEGLCLPCVLYVRPCAQVDKITDSVDTSHVCNLALDQLLLELVCNTLTCTFKLKLSSY